ncbi:MAG: porphobilinogen synthase [Bdellovibrionota bacterium]
MTKKVKIKKLLKSRPRRLRQTASIRSLVQETDLLPRHLILPLFITDGKASDIASMPGVSRLTLDGLLKTAEKAHKLGIPGIALFPHIHDSKKDSYAAESANEKGFLQNCVRKLKNELPELTIITDVAMDPYSTDGHDGVVKQIGKNAIIDNDETLPILARMAISQAAAGADFVAPSDMMDGRIGYIRDALDENGFENVGIIAYSAKYSSGFYGPFRDALDSAPRFGDKKTYQMNPTNQLEALREVRLDIKEGADIVMVKPALSYLDVIAKVKAISSVPVAAYNVSGEYSMVKVAAKAGLIDEKKVTLEILGSIRRAGADMILTYHALEAAGWLKP